MWSVAKSSRSILNSRLFRPEALAKFTILKIRFKHGNNFEGCTKGESVYEIMDSGGVLWCLSFHMGWDSAKHRRSPIYCASDQLSPMVYMMHEKTDQNAKNILFFPVVLGSSRLSSSSVFIALFCVKLVYTSSSEHLVTSVDSSSWMTNTYLLWGFHSRKQFVGNVDWNLNMTLYSVQCCSRRKHSLTSTSTSLRSCFSPRSLPLGVVYVLMYLTTRRTIL